jgi:hypothetical protein
MYDRPSLGYYFKDGRRARRERVGSARGEKVLAAHWGTCNICYPDCYPKAALPKVRFPKSLIFWQEWQGSNLRPPVLEFD